MRVLVVGEGPSANSLRQAYEAMGAEVRVCAVTDEIRGFNASAIIVDELLDDFERVIVDGAGSGVSPAGLLASVPAALNLAMRQTWTAPAKHGNPRPYLKRKKGRS